MTFRSEMLSAGQKELAEISENLLLNRPDSYRVGAVQECDATKVEL